ncbi:outer membrane beta-barrel protein [Winogradskyella sp.]|uniref:outer membrane beta-barrel protein n=1 Tax=Winogradskyella sp. TaxID=1883156 RepID=UPI003BAD9DCF
MNKTLSMLLIAASTLFIGAQSGSGIGIKGGINFGSTGDLTSDVFNGFNNISISQGTNLEFGYHIGVFGKLNFGGKFYVRPEVVFTKRQNEYDIIGADEQEQLNISSLDVPILLGIKVIGPVSFFIGPSFHYILDKSIDSPGDFNILDIENDLMLGINTGIAVNIQKFGIDLRYERTFGENLMRFQSDLNQSFFAAIDTRAEQIILSISYKLL